MNYRSTKETADIWKLSARRVTLLASSGRIPGAKLIGKTWLIPEDAEKPLDSRYKKNYIYKEETFFPLLVFIYDSYETAQKILSEKQFELYRAQRLCVSGNFIEADKILSKILSSTKNLCYILGALYFKNYTDIFLNNQVSLLKTYSIINNIDVRQMDNSEELSLILLDIKGILTGNNEYIKNFKINQNYNYCSESLPYLILLEAYTSLITKYTSGEKMNPVLQESACIFMKHGKYVYSEISLHIYIALMYKIGKDYANSEFHIKKAMTLAEENEINLPLITCYKYIHDELSIYINEESSFILKQIPELALAGNRNFDEFLHKMNISNINYKLTNDELLLIEKARLGLTNKEIAKDSNISESYVSKKYFLLCKKTGTSSKKELVDMYLRDMKS